MRDHEKQKNQSHIQYRLRATIHCGMLVLLMVDHCIPDSTRYLPALLSRLKQLLPVKFTASREGKAPFMCPVTQKAFTNATKVRWLLAHNSNGRALTACPPGAWQVIVLRGCGHALSASCINIVKKDSACPVCGVVVKGLDKDIIHMQVGGARFVSLLWVREVNVYTYCQALGLLAMARS